MKDTKDTIDNKDLVSEIQEALKSVKGYGSVEIYVQDGKVTQITVRNIRKTSNLQIKDKN